MTYVPLTVSGRPTVTFSVTGHPGFSIDGALLAENHDYLVTSSGDYITY